MRIRCRTLLGSGFRSFDIDAIADDGFPLPQWSKEAHLQFMDEAGIACCNDGTRPVIFKIERIDIPENDEEQEWLSEAAL